ncbi:DNA-3-methyladenine glycosylase [Nakamurella sp. UYEF19]|uniref:DNA-3-methyladenine glycosylase n=1 Tax=Nakamurella sp. UYEF19 TaxID=1756392 RepID=UPI00339A99CE
MPGIVRPSGGRPLVGRVLSRASLRGDAVLLAPTLLGRVIVSDSPQGRVVLRITEVEAYRGDDDPASHAFRGLTRRNAVMFDEPGHLYTYFVYGMHWCANIVTGPVGLPSAVLLRAGEVLSGVELAASRRAGGTRLEHLGRGPAGLASVLGLGAEQNGLDLCLTSSRVTLRTGEPVPDALLSSGPRVGVNVGAQLPWRFWVTGSPSVSAYRAGVRRRP